MASNPKYRFFLSPRYQSEIEYLGSNIGQCIDTGVVPTANTVVEIDFEMAYTIYNAIYGNYIDESHIANRIIFANNARSFYVNAYGRAGNAFSITVPSAGRHTARVAKTGATIDGVTISMGNNPGTANNTSIALFRANVATGQTAEFVKKIYSCRIFEGTTLIRDFVPYRVGDTGYMLDRLSGTLYGNVGYDEPFILGNDIESPARPLWSESLGISFNRESNEQFFRRTLDGQLTFIAEDYDNIVAQPFDTEFKVRIDISYDNGTTWASYWFGKFYKTDCKFDADSKSVVVRPSPDDVYGAILAGLDKEYNLIELLPEIVKIKYDKRPLLQIYSPGESVISCFLSGMWWEQECTPEGSTSLLQSKYKFGLMTALSGYRLTGGLNMFIPGDSSEYVYTEQGSYPGGWLYELVRTSDGARWYNEGEPGEPPISQPYPLYPDPDTTATDTVYLEDAAYSVYGRMLLDLDSISGQNTYPIPIDDIVENNRNYSRIFPYTDNTGLILTETMSSTPTQWGLYEPGKYYKQPYVTGMSGIYPVARSTWSSFSLWYGFSVFSSVFDTAGRKSVILNDAYPLYSVISVLLAQFAPDVTFGGGIDYSTFLYGTPYQTGWIKEGSWKLYITPKSNILNSGYDSPAQKAPITLKAIFDMLRDCFRCFWFIDEENRLRIEHIQYFRKGGQYSGSPVVGIDLTAMKNIRNDKAFDFGLSQYSFNKPDMPQRYEFAWMDDVTDVFEGKPIEMANNYVEEGKVEKISISQFTSDIDYMLLNPGSCSQDGFALLGAIVSGEDLIIPYFPSSIYEWQNGYMAFSILQQYYYYDLPASKFWVGETTGRPLTAEGTKRLKVQEVSFPSAEDPDIIKLIKTSIGSGQIEKLSINLSSRNVKATIHHDTE